MTTYTIPDLQNEVRRAVKELRKKYNPIYVVTRNARLLVNGASVTLQIPFAFEDNGTVREDFHNIAI